LDDLNIEDIKKFCICKKLRWTNHIMMRLIKRNISMNNVEYAIKNGEIIEPYPDDYPHPSCLILGTTSDNQPLHVVCGISPAELHLITAYYPDPAEWSEDFKVRKEINQ